MTRVKICGLTRIRDVDAAIEQGADAFGVVFEPSSPRYALDHPEALQIRPHIGPYGVTVAVYGPYLANPIDALFTLVQSKGEVGGRSTVRTFRFEAGTLRTAAVDAIDHLTARPAAVLIDGYTPTDEGGTGARADWALAAEIVSTFPSLPVVLAGGLTPENVGEAIRIVRPYAVDVSSGVEIEGKPGVKDPFKIRDFIQAAKQA